MDTKFLILGNDNRQPDIYNRLLDLIKAKVFMSSRITVRANCYAIVKTDFFAYHAIVLKYYEY